MAGIEQQVRCCHSPSGYHVGIRAIGSFMIPADGARVLLTERSESDEQVQLAALGPPLVLALALQGAFCMHAGAVNDGRGVIGFCGASGAGKSTLAARLAQRPGWSRVADDGLIVELGERGAEALAHFPQLKLSAEQQPWLHQPERLPLRGLYILERSDGRLARSEPMAAVDAALAILGRTVAASLFAADLGQSHLDFCADLAESVAVRRLRYPWMDGVAEQVARLIGADFG